MCKSIPSIKRDIEIMEIDFGEYYVIDAFQYCYQYTVGNKLIAGILKTPVKLTKRQTRKLKQSWYRVIRESGHDWIGISFNRKKKNFC
ncbi:hypothetical protein VmeM32_00049 [Vibrio phage vB_VmeM-32]|nr:hypothetical protein VmeM32_00049 [Vibrio phage vB_VmeM-32]